MHTRTRYLSIVIFHFLIVSLLIYLWMLVKTLTRLKREKSFSCVFLSDSAVSTHAPSSALQEIRKEKRLTAQFHKTPPRHHFIFSEPFFSSIYLFHCLLKNKQSDKSSSFSGNLSGLPCYWRHSFNPGWLQGAQVGCRPIRRVGSYHVKQEWNVVLVYQLVL